jgi:cellulose synthase/poly-beta-1,6-N-acetylglucosamine synthase-like glycosyltransferase
VRSQKGTSLQAGPHPGRIVEGEELGAVVAAHRMQAHRTDAQQSETAAPNPRQFTVAIIPAHNEQDRIGACLSSLHRQSYGVDLIIVVADNCTDDTVTEAVTAGATVVETVGNIDRKAGALNFALNRVLGQLDDDDGVLLMDADTELSDGFVAVANRHLWAPTNDSPVGGVGGIFVGSRHLTDDRGRWSLVRQLQHNEYVRYSRHLARRQGRALVLTGTGSLFRAGALSEVARARQLGLLPDEGNSRSVYDTASLTEDNELTLSLKQLGYRTQSPRECLVYTAMMPTVGKLFEQRRRWQRGALENLASHGLGRHTAPYILRQMGTYLGVLFLPLYVVTLSTALIRFGAVDWLRPLWVTVAVVYLIEQAWSVRRGGWRSVGLSLAVIPELWHTIVLNCVYAVSLLGLLAGTGERWGRGVDERSGDQSAQANHSAPGQPQAPRFRNPLAATHCQHTLWRLLLIPVVVAMAAAMIVVLPLVALGAAWTAIAAFVLAGFFLTLIRLVPLPMA